VPRPSHQRCSLRIWASGARAHITSTFPGLHEPACRRRKGHHITATLLHFKRAGPLVFARLVPCLRTQTAVISRPSKHRKKMHPRATLGPATRVRINWCQSKPCPTGPCGADRQAKDANVSQMYQETFLDRRNEQHGKRVPNIFGEYVNQPVEPSPSPCSALNS